MADKFILDISNLNWAIMNAAGEFLQTSLQSTKEGLEQKAEGKEVIVLVPGDKVLLAHCKLPKMSNTRLRAAIPYALEDQLIDDIDASHFAPFPSVNGEETIVLVVNHEIMQKWLRNLQEMHIKVDRLIPASLALPVSSESDSAYIVVQQKIMVRADEFTTFTCDKEEFNFYFSTFPKVKLANVVNYTNVPLNLDIRKQEKFLSEEQYILDLASNVIKLDSRINLLQGPYTLKSTNFNHIAKLKKTLIPIAVAWILLLLLYPLISYYMLRSREGLIEHEIGQIYKSQFPQAQSVVAPKLRMKEKLAHLKNQRSDDNFLILIAKISKGLQNSAQIKLKRFDYQNKQFLLTVSARSSEEITDVSNALIREGLSVKQQNALSTGNEMNATLQIE